MKKTFLLIALCFLPLLCGAQGNEAMPFIRIVQDPVYQGMGGIGFASESASVLGDSKGSVTGAYQNFSGTGYFTVKGGGKILPWMEVLGSATFGTCKPYDIINDMGVNAGSFTPKELVCTLGASFRLIDWLSAGFNVRYASQTIADDANYSSIGGDVFAACRFDGFRAALGVIGLGSGVKSVSGSVSPLPTSIKLGACYSVDLNGSVIEAGADGDYFFKSGLALSLGTSYSYKGYVTLRAGYHYGGKSVIPSYTSVGLGTAVKGFSLNAAYLIGSDGMSNSFCAGLGYRF